MRYFNLAFWSVGVISARVTRGSLGSIYSRPKVSMKTKPRCIYGLNDRDVSHQLKPACLPAWNGGWSLDRPACLHLDYSARQPSPRNGRGQWTVKAMSCHAVMSKLNS